jgi:MFS family permease
MVSQTGNWMQITGRAVLVYELTGSTTDLGTVYFLAFAPQLFLSQFAGVIADRFDRRRVLMGAQALAMLGAVAMGLLAASGEASVANVGALSFVMGLVQTTQMPTQQALVPSLVPRAELPDAVALNAASQATTRVFGPLLASAVAAVAPLSWLFWGNAVSFAVILLVWRTVPVPRHTPAVMAGPLRAIAEGFRYVRRSPPLAVAIGTTFVVVGLGNVYQPMGVVYATDVLGGGDHDLGTTYYGVLQAALGSGALIGVLGLTDLARRRPQHSILLSSTGFALALIGLGLVHRPILAVPIAVVVGACHFSTSTSNLTVVQLVSPEAMRGRLVALHSLGFAGMLPIISVVGGWLSAAVGIGTTFVIVGCVCLAYCVPLSRLSRWVRHLPATTPTGDVVRRAETVAEASREADGAVRPAG